MTSRIGLTIAVVSLIAACTSSQPSLTQADLELAWRKDFESRLDEYSLQLRREYVSTAVSDALRDMLQQCEDRLAELEGFRQRYGTQWQQTFDAAFAERVAEFTASIEQLRVQGEALGRDFELLNQEFDQLTPAINDAVDNLERLREGMIDELIQRRDALSAERDALNAEVEALNQLIDGDGEDPFVPLDE